MKLLDVVCLRVPLPEHKLPDGARGTIVHVHNVDEFEVEFLDSEGATAALLTLHRAQLELVRSGPE
jgi:hypothetical protein